MDPDVRYVPPGENSNMEKQKDSKMIRFVQLMLILINVTFFLFGAAIATLGIYITVDHGTVSEIIGSSLYSSGSYVLIFAGFVIIFVSFCGCFGFNSKNRCLVLTYTIILALLLLLMFVGFVLIFAFRDSMSIAAKKVMNYTLTHNYGRQRLVTDSWNYTQKKLRCCGVDDMSWEVYDNSYWDRFTNANEADRNKKIPKTSPFYRFVPISCCWTLIDPRTTWPTDTYRDVGRCQHWQFGPPNHKTGAFNDALYSRGCFGAATEYLEYHGRFIGGVAVCVTLALIAGLIASIIVIRHLNKNRPQRDGGYPPESYPPDGYPQDGYPQDGYPQDYPPDAYPPDSYPGEPMNYEPEEQRDSVGPDEVGYVPDYRGTAGTKEG